MKKTENSELGFGTKTSSQQSRLINKDGSFNIDRIEQSNWKATSVYHALITMSWRRFNFFVLLYFISINLFFTCCYFFAGTEGLRGIESTTPSGRFLEAFFFSTQTFSTVGFGYMSPSNHLTSSIAAVESLVGLLGLALATGLLYGRFSRPVARIIFSKKAIIAPFKGATAFQFRIANKMRNSQITDMECRLSVAKFEIENGVRIRRFKQMELEVKNIVFFPMTWTINHPIDENSPIYGMSIKDMEEADTEFLISLHGFDDTFAQTVNARFSYTYEEVIQGAKFVSIFSQNANGQTSQDLNKIDNFELVNL